MLSNVIFLATLVSIIALNRHGLETTFLRVWIPFFLVMPTIFLHKLMPGVPAMNFTQTAIIPILLVLVRNYRDQIRFGTMEILLVLYMGIRVFADFLGRGYSDAQNYAFYLLTCIAGPYLLGRYVINSRRMDIATARMFVGIFLLFFPMFLYEAKFWVSPVFKLISPLFPDAYSGLSLRYGIARTAGTFEHPILACIMVLATYRLHRWLCWNGEWQRNQTGMYGWWQGRTRSWPVALDTQISIILIVMALMTISRGPWIGGMAAAFLVSAGNTLERSKRLWLVAILFVVAALAGQWALDSYVTPKMGEALSEQAQTMLYRKELVTKYKEFLLERVWWGWGLTHVPKIPGMESVDNAFFLMALQHGVFAVSLFTIIFVYAIFTQLQFGLKAPAGTIPIGFTFSGIYLMCMIAFMTVYMGAQTEPLLFLLLGWGESIKHRQSLDNPGTDHSDAATSTQQPFKRLLI